MNAPAKIAGLPLPMLALAACAGAPASNALARDTAAQPVETAVNASNCSFPILDFKAARLDSAAQAQFTDRFRAAYDRACREGLFAGRPLIDSQSFDPSRLYVMNSPQANVTSIYFGPSAAPPAMLLESPMVPGDGKLSIPSAEELHEAIYCAMVGATEAEQEESGRCLPD